MLSLIKLLVNLHWSVTSLLPTKNRAKQPPQLSNKHSAFGTLGQFVTVHGLIKQNTGGFPGGQLPQSSESTHFATLLSNTVPLGQLHPGEQDNLLQVRWFSHVGLHVRPHDVTICPSGQEPTILV